MLSKIALSRIALLALLLAGARAVVAEDSPADGTQQGQGTETLIDDQVLPAQFSPRPFSSFAPAIFNQPAATPEAWSYDGLTPYIQRFGLAHDIGDGIGFDDSFTTFEYMTPIRGEYDWDILFSDMRFILRNDATVGANLGVGYRVYNTAMNRIFGANVYYDYRNTNVNDFNQLGIGLESLGPILDFRANAYIPDVGRVHGLLPNAFVGHRLILREETAMTGGDFETAVNLLDTARVQARVAGGVYYFDGHGNDNATGWRVRAEGAWDQQYWLDTSLQHDQVFGTTFSVGLAIRYAHRFLPPSTQAQTTMDHKFFRRERDVQTGSIAHRLSAPVERLQNIVLTQRAEIATGAMGVPLNFLHVVEGAAGTGTFEDPYGTLSAAMLDPDAGTSITYTPFGGNYVENVTLVAGATILSNGPLQFVSTQFGQQLLPFSGASPDLSMLPSLTGDVTMDDNTRFSGFDVLGGIGAAGVMNVTLDNNVVSNPLGDAVTLFAVDGATLDNLNLTSFSNRGLLIADADVSATDVTVDAAADDGVEVDSLGTDRTVAFTNLTVTTASMTSVDINVLGAGDLTVTFDGTNSISATGNALNAALTGTAGDLILAIDGTTLASSTGAGANIDGTAGTGTIFITSLSNLTVTNAATGGFLANTATFDADPTTGAIDTVVSSMITIGNPDMTTDVSGDGLQLLDPTGELSIDTLDIFNDSGTGLYVDTKISGTTFSLITGLDSTIMTTGGPAMFLDPLDVDLNFDLVQSDSSPTNGVFIDTVTGMIDIGATMINGSIGTPIVIQNTPAPLTALFGFTTIESTISDAVSDNIDTTTGNGVNLDIQFDSLSITGP